MIISDDIEKKCERMFGSGQLVVPRRLQSYMSNYDVNQIEWLLSEIECFIQRPAISVPSARRLMFALNRS